MISLHHVLIDGQPYQFNRLTILIPEIDLLSWLDEQEIFPKFYWKGQQEMAVMGCLATWDHLPEIQEEGPGTLHVFGGFPFSEGSLKDPLWKEFASPYFFLPAYELKREGNQVQLTLNFLGQYPSDEGLRYLRFTKETASAKEASWQERDDLPNYPAWEKLIMKALSQKGFSKVVLARRTTLSFLEKVNALSILHKVREKARARVTFAFQINEQTAFIGATPERLYARQGREITCDAIAGTFVHDGEEKDPKLKREFSYVKEFIDKTLSPLCTSLSCEEKDAAISAYKIKHIYNCFKGHLKDETTDPALIEALHPTPAIGGFPQAAACAFIRDEEPFERGWYSAPIGFAGQAEAEFAVGIRSALIQENKMHLFAGLGVVEGSQAYLEWNELELKIAQYL